MLMSGFQSLFRYAPSTATVEVLAGTNPALTGALSPEGAGAPMKVSSMKKKEKKRGGALFSSATAPHRTAPWGNRQPNLLVRCFGQTIIGRSHCSDIDSFLRICRQLRPTGGCTYKKKHVQNVLSLTAKFKVIEIGKELFCTFTKKPYLNKTVFGAVERTNKQITSLFKSNGIEAENDI